MSKKYVSVPTDVYHQLQEAAATRSVSVRGLTEQIVLWALCGGERHRGHPVVAQDDVYRYVDNGVAVAEWPDRPCQCGLPNRSDGHDACVGQLSGVMNACCGHGTTREAYVQLSSGRTIHGAAGLAELQKLAREPAGGVERRGNVWLVHGRAVK